MQLKTQTQILSILILGVLILALMLSVFASGIFDDEPTTGSLTERENKFYDELEPAQNMRLSVSGMTVRCRYIGAEPADVSWSFGDGIGAVGKTEATHKYNNDNRYLVAMHVTDEDGHRVTEFAVANVQGNVLADIDVPGTDTTIRLFTATLFITGIAMIVFAISMFWIEIPPRALEQKLRVILGIGLILSGLIAIGFFNPLLDPEQAEIVEGTALDQSSANLQAGFMNAIPQLLMIGILIFIAYVIISTGRKKGASG